MWHNCSAATRVLPSAAGSSPPVRRLNYLCLRLRYLITRHSQSNCSLLHLHLHAAPPRHAHCLFTCCTPRSLLLDASVYDYHYESTATDVHRHLHPRRPLAPSRCREADTGELACCVCGMSGVTQFAQNVLLLISVVAALLPVYTRC